RELADAGRGLALPLYRNGRESVGWWGMMVLLIADAAVTACFVFAYLFLWTARPAEWPPDGTALPGALGPVLSGILGLAAYGCFELARTMNDRDRRSVTGATLLGTIVFGALALVAGWRWLIDLGIDPTAHAYGAAVWTLLG